MPLDVVLVQFCLGVILFFIINWIGKHSYSVGYISISMFAKAEEAPAFNFVLRVLTPLVYSIIIAALLYAMKLDKYVDRFYLVSLYYILFRLGFNIATGRGLLLNWGRQILYWTSIMLLTYFFYDKVIKNKQNILPDFTTVANEIWIIILVFLYQVANKIELSQDGTVRRKEGYLTSKYVEFKQEYGKIIDEKFVHPHLKALVYAIIIYENFNRPWLARVVEDIRFKLTKKPHTLGVMQVYTREYISDVESVEKGTDKILNLFHRAESQYYNNQKESYYSDHWLFLEIVSDYNSGQDYSQGVLELFDIIKDKFYKKHKDEVVLQDLGDTSIDTQSE